MSPRRRFGRRGGRALLASQLVFATLVVAPSARASHYEGVDEVAAQDGVGAAVEWSKLAFGDGAPSALLGRADVFADSLASGALQGTQPLLLTASNKLSAPTAAELERLKAETVTILGGTSAVSAAVADELRDAGYTVRRLSGATRIETAVAVARATTGSRTALLARAFGTADPTAAFADALAAGGWAAESGLPVLLTETERLSGPTGSYLGSEADEVWVVGGPSAVSDATIAQVRALGLTVTRVAGPTRFDTAIAIAGRRGHESAANAQQIVLVDGQGANAWTDGFTAAAYAGRNKAPIVLANSAATTLPAPTLNFLKSGPGAGLVTGWTVPSAQVDQAAQEMGKQAGMVRVMQVRMTGRNVVRPADADALEPFWGHGEDGATGLLTLTVDEQANTIDYTYQAGSDSRPNDSNALVLRRGSVAERGPVVVRFPEPDDDNTGSGTVDAEAFEDPEFAVSELLASPSSFYAEAATTRHEEGAIRGQLPTGGESHLPVKPDLVRIESKGGDNFVVLHFAAPLYADDDLDEADFEVEVGDNLAADINAFDVAQAPGAARPTMTLKLNRDAIKNKTTRVRLLSSGASKLLNNLGEHASAATLTEVTPEDTVAPVFEAVDAVSEGTRVTLRFSEPVHTADTAFATDTAKLKIETIVGGATTTAKVLSGGKVARNDRSSEMVLTLEQTVPSGAEVRATILTPSAVLDGAGKPLSSTGVLVRSVTARAGSDVVQDATATDLTIGRGRFDPVRQEQLVTIKLAGDLARPASIFIVPPPTSTGVWYQRSWGQLTLPSGEKVSLTNIKLGETLEFKLDDSQPVLRDGSKMTILLKDIAVTRTTPSTEPVAVRIGRSDTSSTQPAYFDIEPRGIEVKSTTTVVLNDNVATLGPTPKVDLDLGFSPPLPSGNSVSIDFTQLTSRGVRFGTPTTAASDWSFAWVDEHRLTASRTGATAASTLDLDIPYTTPDLSLTAGAPNPEIENAIVTLTRSGVDEGTAARALRAFHVQERYLSSATLAVQTEASGSVPTTTSTGRLDVGYTVTGGVPLGARLNIDLAYPLIHLNRGLSPTAVPADRIYRPSITAGSGVVSGTVAVNGVETRTTTNVIYARVWLDGDEQNARVATLIRSTNFIREVPLHWVRKTGVSGSNFTNVGERLELTFVHPIASPISSGTLTVKNATTTTTDAVNCGGAIRCTIGDQPNVVIMEVIADRATTPVLNISGRPVNNVTGFAPERDGGTTGTVGVFADLFTVSTLAPTSAGTMPPP